MATHLQEKGGNNPSKVISDLCKKYLAESDKPIVVIPLYVPAGLVIQELNRGEPERVPLYDRIRILNKLNFFSYTDFLDEVSKLKNFDGLVIVSGLPNAPEENFGKVISSVLTSTKCNTIVVDG